MQKIAFLIILILGMSFIPLSFSEEIPAWVKNNASWWSERIISQNEFTNGLEFLINEGIIYIPPTAPGIPGPDKTIPDWVRTTAGWWSDNKIPDSEFINAMKYLIEIGIIQVDAISPEIISDNNHDYESTSVQSESKKLNAVSECYNIVYPTDKFLCDLKVFDAEKYSGNDFGYNSYKLDNINIDIVLLNHENEKIHNFSGITENGFFRYGVQPQETTLDPGLWKFRNIYTVHAFIGDETNMIEKQIKFIVHDDALN
jgi:hypothetical protein